MGRSLRGGLALLTLACCGCAGRVGLPHLSAGPLEQQRREAHQFDPFPDNTVGPKMDGSRPREYSAPPPEPQKARWEPDGLNRRMRGRPAF